MLRLLLMTLHNIAMREDNVERLRELNITQTLLPYLDSHSSDHK